MKVFLQSQFTFTMYLQGNINAAHKGKRTELFQRRPAAWENSLELTLGSNKPPHIVKGMPATWTLSTSSSKTRKKCCTKGYTPVLSCRSTIFVHPSHMDVLFVQV